MRTKIEAIIDRILLLYAVEQGNKYGYMDGNFKLMKIPFMAEWDSVQHGVNTFNYTFYRYDHGPMTTEIYEDAQQLKRIGLLSLPEHSHGGIKLTSSGEALLKSIQELLSTNAQICRFVEDSAKRYAKLGFGELKRAVYDREVDVCGKMVTMAEVPTYCDVVTKLSGTEIPSFSLDDDWIDSLWGCFHYTPDEMQGIRKVRPMQRVCANA